MGSQLRSYRLFALLQVGVLICGFEAAPSDAAKQKPRPSPAPSALLAPPVGGPIKSSLSGEKLTLTWDHFTRRESPPGNKRDSSGIHSLAYTLASFNISTSLAWSQTTPRAPRIWRIGLVNLEVKMRDDRSWVRESLFVSDRDSADEKASKEAILARLLQHEQGHYDIVALIARDLYHDLLALKESKSEEQLIRKIDELKAVADTQIEALNRKYDEQCGDIGRDRENQDRWTKLLAQAKDGKRLASLFAGTSEPAK